MKFFIFEYPSKKSQHPDGEKVVKHYAQGTTKKAAQKIADQLLAQEEPETYEMFKLPKVEQVDRDTWQPLFDDRYGAVNESTNEKTPIFDNQNFDDGLTVSDVSAAVAAIVLFGKFEEYDESQIADIREFCGNLNKQDQDERNAFDSLLSLVLPHMSAIYQHIDENQLLEFVALIDHTWLISQNDVERTNNAAITHITDVLGLEYQQEITEIEPEIIEQAQKQQYAEPTIKPDAFSFDFPALDEIPEPCTFEADLEQLNIRLDAIEPGSSLVIDDLENKLYHACRGYSNSTLKTIGYDPSLVEWRKAAPVDHDKVEELSIGDAVHTAILEPEHYASRYAIAPDIPKRSKEDKQKHADFEAANKNKLILTSDQNRMIKFMAGSALAHPVAKKLLNPEIGKAESSVFWRCPDSEILFKIRMDWMCVFNGQHIILDVKSCPNVWEFEKSIANYDYHQQDAFYSKIYENVFNVKPVFCFLAVSKSISLGQYPVRLCVLDEYDKEAGAALLDTRINTLIECETSGIWGGFETITRPAWAKKTDFVI